MGLGTLRPVQSTLEALEGNKVKLIVHVEAAEFDKNLDAAFKKLAAEVRLPGFRPGKAPRKVLEARIGSDYARQEAFRDSLPDYYVEAVKEHEVDVISPPEIEITDGEESGDVTFDAVVEVRPSIEISGYEALEVTVPNPTVGDEEIDEQIEKMLGQYGTLEEVDRPAETGDRVTIDIAATYDDEELEGLTATGYVYQVGMGAVVPELDENLEGASAGDNLEFSAAHPDEDEDGDIEFKVAVSAVQATVLPTPDDEWAKENSEFETLEELRNDTAERLGRSRKIQAVTARRNNVAEAIAALVDDESVPSSLVDMELENRAQDMAMRLQQQGLDFEQFLQFSGQSREDMLAQMREGAELSARVDLALRAIVAAEGMETTEEELAEEFGRVATQVNRSADDVRNDFTSAGQLPAVRSDLAKSKALDWLVESATLVDEDGNSVAAADLEIPEEPNEAQEPNESEED